jgi:16S rRNA (uracil1498-N3)-methyltransferase
VERGSRTACTRAAPARPPLFLVEALPPDAEMVLDGAEGRHAALVRRLRPGESLVLSNGAGGLAECTVVAVERHGLRLAVGRRSRQDAPRPRLVVVQALAKGERGELAVELLTEVGVDEIVPWAAARSVVRWSGERGERALARWRSSAREAAKQSRRAWLPAVAAPHDTDAVCARLRAASAALVLHETAAEPIASVMLPAPAELSASAEFPEAAEPPTPPELVAVVGPEGGIAPDELAAFTAAGARAVRLGPTVLRTSTAGAAALAALAVRLGRW